MEGLDRDYWVPEHVRAWLRGLGPSQPLEDMEPHVRAWNGWMRAFGLGTGAWALWVDAGSRGVRVRRYDARMVVPLTWDEEGVTECAFVTRAFWRGRAIDQVQLHLRGEGGAPFSPGEASTRGWTIPPPCVIESTSFWAD